MSFGVTATSPRRPLRDLLPAASVNVALSTGDRLARRVLSARDLRRVDGRVTLEFALPERAACEFRVFAQGRTALRVELARPCRRLGSL